MRIISIRQVHLPHTNTVIWVLEKKKKIPEKKKKLQLDESDGATGQTKYPSRIQATNFSSTPILSDQTHASFGPPNLIWEGKERQQNKAYHHSLLTRRRCPCVIRSITRPGVPMTISTPLDSWLIWGPSAVPPYTAIDPRSGAIRLNSRSICQKNKSTRNWSPNRVHRLRLLQNGFTVQSGKFVWIQWKKKNTRKEDFRTNYLDMGHQRLHGTIRLTLRLVYP